MIDLTHSELVTRALSWAKTLLGAELAIKEIGTGYHPTGEVVHGLTRDFDKHCDEQPDVWCWVPYRQLNAMPQGVDDVSVNIECKATRSDFLSDRKKPTRINPEQGSGRIRWYFTNPGVCTTDELPDGWGLVTVAGKRHRYLRSPKPIEQSDVGRARDMVAMRKIANEYRRYSSVLYAQIMHDTDLDPAEHTWTMNGTRPVKV